MLDAMLDAMLNDGGDDVVDDASWRRRHPLGQ